MNPSSKIIVLALFSLVFFTSLTNIPVSNAFLPMMGGTNIIQDTVQGFCNITNQTTTMHCGPANPTLHITHGVGMSVKVFPGNFTIWLNATGATGPQGPTGPTGPTGATGAPGSQIYTGAGAPSAGLGINGDFYINVTTGDYYSKSGGSWVLKGNLTGPQGPTGPTGPSGRNGTNGTNGRNGTNGTSAFFNNITCSANQFVNAYNNATHLASCALPLNTAQVVDADSGTSLISSKLNATESKLKTLGNVTNYVNWNHNTTRITPAFQFKINTLTCPVNSAFISYNNVTGLLTCQAFGNVTNINDLGDVVISGVASGQILQYQSPVWKNINFKANTLSCPVNQAFVSFNNATGTLSCQAFGNATNINDLGDVVITSASNGQILQYTSPNWKNINFKANTLSCPANQAFVSFNNSTGTLTCQAFGSGTLTAVSNIGHATGSKGVYSSISGSTAQLRNMSSTRTDLVSINANVTDITFNSNFKSNNITCSANNFITAFSNSTGLFTCSIAPVTAAITSLNSDTTASQNIVRQVGNTTVLNSTNTHTIGLGVNPVIVNGKYQDITKPLKVDQLNASSSIVDNNDNTKKVTFVNSGMTTAVTTTIRNNATSSQGFNLPATVETETFALRPALNATSPADPTGTTSTTGVMSGMLAGFTPEVTGRVQIIIEGDLSSLLAADGVKVDARYGTGASPANAAALSGTVCGKAVQVTAVNSAANLLPFTLTCQVTGLTIGTHIWIELGQYAISASTASIKNIAVSVMEI